MKRTPPKKERKKEKCRTHRWCFSLCFSSRVYVKSLQRERVLYVQESMHLIIVTVTTKTHTHTHTCASEVGPSARYFCMLPRSYVGACEYVHATQGSRVVDRCSTADHGIEPPDCWCRGYAVIIEQITNNNDNNWIVWKVFYAIINFVNWSVGLIRECFGVKWENYILSLVYKLCIYIRVCVSKCTRATIPYCTPRVSDRAWKA